ncbi:GntR family transcriptional regulator [Streptomyces sp. NPDC050433]|uniref:GntR family transcriptional regulator n=1 Tax=Streptomyces sp. NPDC050433 TaxID=3365615 RepID=UPI0037909490
MPFQAPPTLGQAIVRQLRDEIITGALEPDAVVKDSEIASRLGVSITPVREAVAQLMAEGLISTGPARSRRVTRVTRKSALDLVDVMEVIACAGAAWGIPRLSDQDLASMRGRLDKSVAALERGDVATAGTAAVEVTVVMTEAGDNQELRTHLDLVVARALRLLTLTSDSGVWDLWHTGYGAVIELLERGEPAVALARYREIYRDFRALVEGLELTDDRA